MQAAEAGVPTPAPPPFKFDVTNDAIIHNSKLLKKYDYDLEALLNDHQHTSVAFGSEFRPLTQLEPIFGKQDLFPFFAKVHKRGMSYELKEELTEDERMAELEAQLLRGNHLQATQQPEKLKEKVHFDVKCGFAVPVGKLVVPKIKEAMVQPCNLADQFTLTDTGERVNKKRLTHDLSFWITKMNASINKRCDMEKYPGMVYGFCLHRIIHYICALRLKFPNERILISKYDFSDAYRRIAHSARAVAQTILVIENVAYLCLRLSYGGAPNPPTFCCCSEMVNDLSNEIPLMPEWDPETLHSPLQPSVPEARVC